MATAPPRPSYRLARAACVGAAPREVRVDDMTVWTILVVIGGTLLTILLTGPGLWSEKWGWGWLDRKRKRKPENTPR